MSQRFHIYFSWTLFQRSFNASHSWHERKKIPYLNWLLPFLLTAGASPRFSNFDIVMIKEKISLVLIAAACSLRIRDIKIGNVVGSGKSESIQFLWISWIIFRGLKRWELYGFTNRSSWANFKNLYFKIFQLIKRNHIYSRV